MYIYYIYIYIYILFWPTLRIYTPYITVCLVISLPKISFTHCIYVCTYSEARKIPQLFMYVCVYICVYAVLANPTLESLAVTL